ncbi:MAG: alpha/beta hydrolase [Trebonia sp.]
MPETLTVTDPDGVTIYVYRWRPRGTPRGVVHVAHGMGEHARRYDRVAEALLQAGFAVHADDHRASGRTGADTSTTLGPGSRWPSRCRCSWIWPAPPSRRCQRACRSS